MGRRTATQPISPKQAAVQGGFWGPRVAAVRTVSLAEQYAQLKATGRFDAHRWRPGRPGRPHVFWNSDVAKWIEASAYAVMARRDTKLERAIDHYVDGLVRMQLPNGYVNDHYCLVETGKQWTNLRDNHELYCAGHLMEAAVAYYHATGKRTFLDAMVRFADHIGSTFGRSQGKKRGYPGHEEIELALVRLYRATGESRYLRLSEYFVLERGRKPNYFGREARARGEEPQKRWYSHDYQQAHVPVLEQSGAVGHAVRALYLYSGMADVAAETGNRELLAVCRRLWDSVTSRRMYVTGGAGDSRHGERFTFDRDLPNDTAYAETCAAIALVFFAQRMVNIEHDSRYADVMERALYNGVMSGISLDGRRYFYENPLAVLPAVSNAYGLNRGSGTVERQEWFGCACCPPNIARLIMSLGSYVYSQERGTAWVHLYVNGHATLDIGGRQVKLTQRTGYPWKERVELTVEPDRAATCAVAVRLPGWCRAPSIAVNGLQVAPAQVVRKGYAVLRRTWQRGDRIELRFPMPVERVEAHPAVRHDCGRVALQRGPVVYCFEQVDNGPNLHDLLVPRNAKLTARFMPRLLGGCPVVEGRGARRSAATWGDKLYRAARTATEPVRFRAVPYALWCNRTPGEMVVWVRSD